MDIFNHYKEYFAHYGWGSMPLSESDINAIIDADMEKHIYAIGCAMSINMFDSIHAAINAARAKQAEGLI